MTGLYRRNRFNNREHGAKNNNLKRYQPGLAHYWLTAPSADNHPTVSRKDTVQDDGTDNTVVVVTN